MGFRSGATALLGAALAALAPAASADAQDATFDVAFQSDRDGSDSEIWLISSDGTSERQLTANRTPDAAPAWSPDGSTIVYACAPRGRWDLCTVDPATLFVTQLTRTAVDEFDPVYTANGRRIVLETYPTGRLADLATVRASGGVPKVVNKPTPAVDEQDPSPDAIRSDRGSAEARGTVSTYDLDTRRGPTVRPTGVTFGRGEDTDPSLSRDRAIAFARRVGSTRDIFATDPKAKSPRADPLTRGSADDFEPAWTDDGKALAFVRTTDKHPTSRIFTMAADGSGVRAVTTGGATGDSGPAPRPARALLRAAALRVAWAAGGAVSPQRTAPIGLIVIAASCSDPIDGATNGPNTLVGTSKNDCIRGRGGDDYINGGKGSDSLEGEDGNDTFKADDGIADKLIGGGGADHGKADPHPRDILTSVTRD
jgi:hypothetical protein